MWHQLKQETKPIVLYGMGDGADKILDQCQARGIPVAGVFASDGFVRHNEFRGYTVLSYQEACARFGPMTVLVAFGTHQPDVMARHPRHRRRADALSAGPSGGRGSAV